MSTPRPKGHRPQTRPKFALRHDDGSTERTSSFQMHLGALHIMDVAVEFRGRGLNPMQPGDIVKSLQGARFVR